MKTRTKWILAIVGVLLVIGAIGSLIEQQPETVTLPARVADDEQGGGTLDESPTSTPVEKTAPTVSVEVDWENYDPSVKRRIDRLTAAGNCVGLQSEFDTAQANSDAQLARTGDGNADLMEYLDESLRNAECYA
jgi:hypothetical protein